MKPQQKAKTHVFWNEIDWMDNEQLQLAWLGCIFTNPLRCRNFGLLGLDPSMFENRRVFEVGASLLRDFLFDGTEKTLSEENIQSLLNLGALQKIFSLEDSCGFLPAAYKTYCHEIEKRASL